MRRLLAILLPLAVLSGAHLAFAASASAARPNVVVVMSDDQTPESIAHMPWLSERDAWTSFEHAYANQPLCCPARATLLSGRYAHRHGVTSNPAARRFDERKSLARWLDRAGYRTGLFGKYLNGFPWSRGRDYVPPGWDRWVSFHGVNGRYYDYEVSVDGKVKQRGDAPGDYSTDLFARHAKRFVRAGRQPFFALVTPFGPHEPAQPAPRHAGTFADDPVELAPNFNVVAPDQPAHYRSLPPVSEDDTVAAIRRSRDAALAVDDAVHGLKRVLSRRGVLDRTVIVYLSDNSLAFGSHRHLNKNCLYEACARVPLMMRYPGAAGGQVSAPVSNVDLAPTIAELARARPNLRPDGRSVAPYLQGSEPWPDDHEVLLEVHKSQQGVPDGYAIVGERWKYARHETGEVELYDLEADPYELDNLADEPDYDQLEAQLAERLDDMIEP